MTNEYENHGDVNPLMHGGIWVKKVSDNVFEIIKNDPENMIIDDLEVDITDNWIEKKSVMSFIGMTENNFDPIQYAIGCTYYYSSENFGTIYTNQSENDVIQFLAARGIAVE